MRKSELQQIRLVELFNYGIIHSNNIIIMHLCQSMVCQHTDKKCRGEIMVMKST